MLLANPITECQTALKCPADRYLATYFFLALLFAVNWPTITIIIADILYAIMSLSS